MIRADKLSEGEDHQSALVMCMLRYTSLLILDEPSVVFPYAANEMYKTLDVLRFEITKIMFNQIK
jgi:ABC-type branched-subunit amino acid transport system ATPase component